MIMRKLLIFISFLFIVSCHPRNKKEKAPQSGKSSMQKTEEDNVNEYRLKTKTGKGFLVKELKESASLGTIYVIPEGFMNTTDTFVIREADPVAEVFTADLNGDGFDELYVVTRSAGSGSYATVHAWSSNRDKSVTPVYVRELPEKEKREVFKGYMGHDSVYVEDNRLVRKFPVYKNGDANCCPSGGTKVVKYALKQGEASWLLEIDEN